MKSWKNLTLATEGVILKLLMINAISQNEKLKLNQILREVQSIRSQLQKFLVFIPEESIKKYKDKSQIKKAYLKSLQKYPPK